MLTRPHYRGIHRDGPCPGPRPHRIRLAAGPGSSPRCRPRTSGDAGTDGLPVPEPFRQVAPRVPSPGAEQDPVDHQPVIVPPVSLPRMAGQRRLQPRPFRITEVMPPQPFLIHGAIETETTYKIYGTRLVAGMTDSQMGSLLRQPGCRLRARSRALLPDLGRDRRPGALPVLPDDRIADEPQAMLPLFHLARPREGHWLADGRFAPPRSRHRHGGGSRSVDREDRRTDQRQISASGRSALRATSGRPVSGLPGPAVVRFTPSGVMPAGQEQD
jgi:hypothetical protein